MAEPATDFKTYREHFDATYAGDGLSYDDVRHAYVFGQQLALDAFFAGRIYDNARPHLMARYETRFGREYEPLEAAARFGYERTAGARTTVAGWIKDAKEGASLALEEEPVEYTAPVSSTAIRYDLYHDDFRRHHKNTYGDADFEEHREAYHFGLEAARSDRYKRNPYAEIEEELRVAFEERYPDKSFDDVKQAVQYGYAPSIAKG